jgi:hypothetical protein
MLRPFGNFLEKVFLEAVIERELSVDGGSRGLERRAFAEWQRETSLPESDL